MSLSQQGQIIKEVNLSEASQRTVSNIHEFSISREDDNEDKQKQSEIISFNHRLNKKNKHKNKNRLINRILIVVATLSIFFLGIFIGVSYNAGNSDTHQKIDQSITTPQIINAQKTGKKQSLPAITEPISDKHPNNKPNQNLKCSKYFDLNQKLKRNLTASSIQNYFCSGLDYVFDRYSESQGKLYKMTNYKIILKTCGGNNQQSPSNQMVQKWNKDRLIVEWALRTVKPKDKVVLVKSNKYNLLQLILISRLVGPQGSLTIVSDRGSNGCLQENMNMHSLNNIIFQKISSVNFFKGYNVIISQIQAPELKAAFPRLIQQAPQKRLLLYLSDHTYYSSRATKMTVSLFQIGDDKCSQPIISLPAKNVGYFSFSKAGFIEELPLKINGNLDSIANQFTNEYDQLMSIKKVQTEKRIKNIQNIHHQCLCLTKENRKYNDYIVSVYGNRLKGATEEEVNRWESEREPVEWIRGKVKPDSSVYYQSKTPNLLAISEISRILSSGRLYVQCNQPECSRIKLQKLFEGLNNIQIVQSSLETALKAHAIITDNQEIIDKAIAADFLQRGQILAYFTRQRQTSFKVFANVLPNHRVTQIEAFAEECIGYQQKHYFWDIDELRKFYEIVPSTEYRIFTYWNGSPKILTPNRRQSLKQFIDAAMVQLKVFNQQTFLLVQGLVPIHEAFKYMQPGHQSDYFRIYMVHSYGGAWADIKHHHYDWRPYFKKLYDDPTKLALGYHQKAANHVGCNEEHSPPACSVIYANYRDYIGNGEFIYKKKSVLTQEILAWTTKVLDKKFDEIKANPPRIVRDYYGRQDQYGVSKYPLRWAEVFGEYTARVAYAHPGVYLYDLPYVLMIDYI